MTKNLHDRRKPRVNWDKLRKGPTAADLKAVPPATPEEWRADGYIAVPLPKKIAKRLAGPKPRAARSRNMPRVAAE